MKERPLFHVAGATIDLSAIAAVVPNTEIAFIIVVVLQGGYEIHLDIEQGELVRAAWVQWNEGVTP